MPSGFIYKSGPTEMSDMPTTASTAIARADALKSTSGKVLVLTTGVKCVGIADGVKTAGDTATTDISVVELVSFRTRFLAWEKRSSGSLAATDRHKHCDMSGTTGAMGMDSSTAVDDGANDGTEDLYICKNIVAGAANVGNAHVVFADPVPAAYTA